MVSLSPSLTNNFGVSAIYEHCMLSKLRMHKPNTITYTSLVTSWSKTITFPCNQYPRLI